MLRPYLILLQIYEGKIDPWVMSDNCTDNVPVLIKRATFCSAFAADARDFRQYNSWVSFPGEVWRDPAALRPLPALCAICRVPQY